MKNKNGQATMGIISLSILAFIFVLIVGTYLYVFGIVNTSLTDSNIIQGNGVNISNYSADTVGKVNTGFLNSADLIGVIFIFGYVISLLFISYFMRDTIPFLFFFIDFLIIIFAYILSTYISNVYEGLLTTLPYSSTIITNLSNSSTLLLNLPKIVIIVGALVVIISYSGIPKSKEEVVAGF